MAKKKVTKVEIEALEYELTPLGKAIKTEAINKDIKLYELAKQVGTSGRYLNHIMYGRRSGEKYLFQIAGVLNINLSKFSA